MDYNEKIYLALRAGASVSVDTPDAHRIATAVRRRLRAHESQAKLMGMTLERKSVIITHPTETPGTSIITMVGRAVPSYTILTPESQP